MLLVVLSALVGIVGATSYGTAATSSGGAQGLFNSAGCTVAIFSETAKNNAVQTAINAYGPLSTASSPVTICLGSATFPEQLTINSTIDLRLIGSGNTSTFITPTSVVGNGNDLDSNLPAYAVVGAWNDAGLTISGLSVSGSSAQSSVVGNCNDQFYGIYFADTSGTINSTSVSGISSNGGCQGQNAVLATNGFFGTGIPHSQTVAVVNSTVTGFGKNGITCDGYGLNCTVTGNTVSTTSMALGYAATNGIQFWEANGSISHNTVLGNNYLPGSCLEQNYFNPGTGCASPYWSGGILIISAPTTVNVTANSVVDNQVGIWSLASPTNASGNSLGGWGYYGIVLDYSPGVVSAFGSFAPAPFTGVARNNQIADQNVGLLAYDDNTTITGNQLSSVNVSIEVATDGSYASTDNVSSNVGSSNVSGALLGSVNSFQTGITATPSATYTVDGNTFENVSGPSSMSQGTGIAIDGASATVQGNTVGSFPSGITAIFGTTGDVAAIDNTVTGPSTAIPGVGVYLFAGNATASENTITGYSWLNGPGWWPNSQATGLFAQCLNRCDVENNTLTNDAIGIALSSYVYGPFPAPGWPYAAPPSNGPVVVDNNTVTDAGAFGIALELNQQTSAQTSTPSVRIMQNSIDNTLSGAVGLMVDQGVYIISGNSFTGTSATGSSGASQSTGVGSIGTASIQVLDAYDSVTRAYVGNNTYTDTTLYTALLNVTTAPPYYAAIYGLPALTVPSTPLVTATALDNDQALTVFGTIPNTGVPAYTWSWLVSLNGGSYSPTTLCTTSGGTGAIGGQAVNCDIPANTLAVGSTYSFELEVTDSATAPVTQDSLPSANVMVSSALTTPTTPTVSSTALDVDQTLTVTSAIPTSGSAPYSWTWMVSVNGGAYSAATVCGTNSGSGASAGSTVTCTVAGNTLTVGSDYAFELQVSDGATVSESQTSGASPTVAVNSSLTAPGTPTSTATLLDLNQPLTFSATLPTTGTGPYSWQWMLSLNGGAYAASTICPTNSGTATGGATITCDLAANSLVAGNTYTMVLQVTDSATTSETQSSAPSPTVSVASALLGVGRPTVYRPALDVNQVLPVAARIPGSGTAPYAWTWLISVNGGSYGPTTQCGVNGGTGAAALTVEHCVIPGGTLSVGSYYNFEITVTDSATLAETKTSGHTLQTVTVSTALTAAAAPTPSATYLDVDQSLVVSATIPSSGTAPYAWSWLVSINGGSFTATTQCATNSGTGASAGATVDCSIAGSTLTAGDGYAFKLVVIDSATLHERTASTVSAIVHVHTQLTAPATPSVSYTRIVVSQALTVRDKLPTTGTPRYAWSWQVSVNGGSYSATTQCNVNSGTGGYAGGAVTCYIPAGTLTSGDTYNFELVVTDSATTAETTTSSASSTVSVV